jgi:Domain of unknown function (DUF5666)
MKQVRNTALTILCLFTAMFVAACGGGGGGTSSTSSTTTTASNGIETGTLTGFGSVIVNGVEFSRKTGLADNKIKLRFENQTSASEDKLRLGMNVTVRWELDASGNKVYKEVEFQPEMRGPIDDNGVDLANNKLTVMGRAVQIETDTVLDSLRDLAEINTDLGNLKHPEIEISGLDDGTVIHATRIAKKSPDFAANTIKLAQIKGAIAASPAPTAASFKIGGVTINTNASTVFANFASNAPTAADFAAGTLVEVKGTLAAGVVTAARIEKKNALGVAKAEDNLRAKGIVIGTPDTTNKTFTIGTPVGAVSVTTDASTAFFKGATSTGILFADIVTAGAKLEVEGTLNASGAVLATKVKVELEKVVKIEGNVAAGAIDTAASTVKLNGVTVAVTALTRLTDLTNVPLASLKDVIANDHLQISGFIDPSGKVVAAALQRTANTGVIFIQGPVTAAANPNLTIMGVSVATTTTTNFFKKDKTPFLNSAPLTAQDNFFNAITVNQTVVKAKFKLNQTGLTVLDEVEIEQQL